MESVAHLSSEEDAEEEVPVVRNVLATRNSALTSAEDETQRAEPARTSRQVDPYSDVSSMEEILERVDSPNVQRTEQIKLLPLPPLDSVKKLKKKISSDRKKKRSRNKENAGLSDDECDMQPTSKKKKKRRKQKRRRDEAERTPVQSERKRMKTSLLKEDQPNVKRKKYADKSAQRSSFSSVEDESEIGTEVLQIPSVHPAVSQEPLDPDQALSDGDRPSTSQARHSSPLPVEETAERRPRKVLVFQKRPVTEPRPAPKHPLVRLNERLFGGQYVKLTRLSPEMIEEKIGSSVRDYLRQEGSLTVSEALRSETYRGVTLSPEERDRLASLRADMLRPPLPPPQARRLKCALCSQEFEDYDERVRHYKLHTSGQIQEEKIKETFPCTLCSSLLDSVEERRRHYVDVHTKQK